MTVAKKQSTTHDSLNRLPALPQVLLQLLDAISHEQADMQEMARVIRQDSGLTARVLALANSSLYNPNRYCNTVERALMCLGLDAVRALILTAALKQYFSAYDQRHYQFMQQYWPRSLMAAQSAHILATLTRYQAPAEAYLCGLMMDVGQLCLLMDNPALFLAEATASAVGAGSADLNADDNARLAQEQAMFGITHAELGAQLVSHWHLGSFAADSVRYHHESAHVIRNAHHLVKIVNLANDFAYGHARLFDKAHQLFGLHEELVSELHTRMVKQVEKTADALDIRQSFTELQAQLGTRLQDAMLIQTLSPSGAAPPVSQPDGNVTTPDVLTPLMLAIKLGLGIERCLVFVHDSGTDTLATFRQPADSAADFQVPVMDTQSLVADAFRSGLLLDTVSADRGELSLAEQQMLRYCQQPHLACLPFRTDVIAGVIVAGTDLSQLADLRLKPTFWRALLQKIMQDWQRLQLLRQSASGTTAADALRDQQVRELIHEVSNPLSVINNYLEVLRQRHSDTPATAQELGILQQEIDRVAAMLLRFRDPQRTDAAGLADINAIVADQLQIFRESMCVTRGIEVSWTPDPKLSPLPLERNALKQIIINLVKNAIEAMPAGGQLTVRSEARILMNGRPFASVTISDSGPGISDSVLQARFKPVRTNKGQSHAGLGLSVVKKLADAMSAQIICSSSSDGTSFRLMFPIQAGDS